MSKQKKVLAHPRHMEAGDLDYPVRGPYVAPGVEVYVASVLPVRADALQEQVASRWGADCAWCSTLFGVIAPACTVVIAPLSSGSDGSGGAYHYGCEGTVLYVDADLIGDGRVTSALVVAELVEVLSAAQGKGWDCGASNGEALSRVLAEDRYPGLLDDYSTAAAWLDGGRPNWIDHTDPTDRSAVSTGCGVLFLFWLRYGGVVWQNIVRAGGATLRETGLGLTIQADPWEEFSALCERRWPSGRPSGVVVDNPWLANVRQPRRPGKPRDLPEKVELHYPGWKETFIPLDAPTSQ